MKVYNRHERVLPADPATVGHLLDSLSGPQDRLWPSHRWPAMTLDAPLSPGAKGGHGPVRYAVSDYEPGRRLVFHFAPSGLLSGFDGRHFFEVVPRRSHTVLRHVIDADCDVRTWLKWLLFVKPLHNALLEDALDRAEAQPRAGSNRTRMGLWVTILRRHLKKRNAAPAVAP